MSKKELKEGDRFYFQPPDWVREIEDDQIMSAVFALLFSWGMEGVKHVDNLREEVKTTFDDISEEQIDEIVRILIEHNVIEPDKK